MQYIYVTTDRCNGKSLLAAKDIIDMMGWEKTNPLIHRFGTPIPQIKNVIINGPATIVYWADGSKTVVKCQEGDIFDAEKGLAMAITKKALGNKGKYCDELKKWLDKYEAESESKKFVAIGSNIAIGFAAATEKFKQFAKSISNTREKRRREKIANAYLALNKAEYNPKATKADLLSALNEASDHLFEVLQDWEEEK